MLPCAEGPQRPGGKSSPAAHGAESKPVILSGQVGKGQLFLRAPDPEGWRHLPGLSQPQIPGPPSRVEKHTELCPRAARSDAGWPPFLLGCGRVHAASLCPAGVCALKPTCPRHSAARAPAAAGEVLHPEQQRHTGLEDAALHPQHRGRLHPGAGRRRRGPVPGEAPLLAGGNLRCPSLCTSPGGCP